MKRIFGKKAVAAAIAVLFSVSLVCTGCSGGSDSGGTSASETGDGTYCNGWLTLENGIVTKCDPNATGTIEIPEGVTTIGDHAFSHCENLTNITIPNSVMMIGDDAFSHCESLTSITIPDCVTTIGQGAFRACGGLTSITILGNMEEVGYDVFLHCSNLKTIYVKDETEKAKWTEEKIGKSGVTVEVK